MRRSAIAVVLAPLVITACAPAASAPSPPASSSQPAPRADLARFYEQRLDWTACDGAECASLQVPVDYATPDAGTLEIAVVRVPAAGDARGTLVVNPGGPGSSGFDYARAADVIVSGAIRDAYDIVGFDPRGVGRSSPVECISDADLDRLIATDGTPDAPAEITELQRASAVLSCSAPIDGLLDNLTTSDSARDLDVLRAAMGQSRLDYLGVSYGTHLGATYAALFPDHVGRFVLDGPLPAALDAEELALGQAIGFEDSLRRFVDYCQRRGDCPLGNEPDVDAGMSSLRALLDSLDATPAGTADPDRPLTEAAATYAILMSLYRSGDRPMLADALASLASGDGNPLQRMLDERVGRSAGGTYRDNALDAFYAVSCRDRVMPVDMEASVERISAAAPFLGEYLAWGNLPCAGSATRPGPVSAPDAPAVLVVATTHDPATPIAWADVFTGQFAEAVLITRDGDGHTGYREGSECIDEAVDAFLSDGTLPDAGLVCG